MDLFLRPTNFLFDQRIDDFFEPLLRKYKVSTLIFDKV